MSGPNEREMRRVVISGAGPAGLLLAGLLLARNNEKGTVTTYNVTLIDSREDYSGMSKEDLSKHHRSWMLSLTDHGMDAIKTLPELYHNYVKDEGVRIQKFDMYLGKKKFSTSTEAFAASKLKTSSDPHIPESGGVVVDRNFVVATIARYVKDTHEENGNYTALYSTKCQYVDYENKQVLIRDVHTKAESYIPYDLLVGCDGVRSTVREALIKCHSNFSCDSTDIFADFKMTHLAMPKEVSSCSLNILPDVLPYCTGIGIPETGGKINLVVGITLNNLDKLPQELRSSDYKVVSKYAKDNFKAFTLVDYDDFGKQWVGQRWNQTGMVHCNFYHSLQTGVVIMGDAAHATSPIIGMGMNTALQDAQVFSEILKESKDDLTLALPAFSEARVKEGNALSDLSMYLNCMDNTQQAKESVYLIIRSFLHLRCPSLVSEHPQTMVGRRGVPLSEVYDQAVRLGIMRKHRAINDNIRMEYFEQKTGMVQAPTNKTNNAARFALAAVSCCRNGHN